MSSFSVYIVILTISSVDGSTQLDVINTPRRLSEKERGRPLYRNVLLLFLFTLSFILFSNTIFRIINASVSLWQRACDVDCYGNRAGVLGLVQLSLSVYRFVNFENTNIPKYIFAVKIVTKIEDGSHRLWDFMVKRPLFEFMKFVI